MYRNSEGYADPTAGAAIEHIAYEECQKRKLVKKKRREAAKKRAAAITKEMRRNNQNKARKERMDWIHAWPKGSVPVEEKMEANG